MIPVISGCVLGAVATLLVVWRGPFSRSIGLLPGLLGDISEAIRRGSDARNEEILSRIHELEDAVDRLPAKWEDVKREAKSFYGRAGHHVRRIEAELQERGLRDPELDDVARDLLPIDGGGSSEQGVLPLREDVEAPEPTPAAWTPWGAVDPEFEAMITQKWRG